MYGIPSPLKAGWLCQIKKAYKRGIIEAVIRQVPEPVQPSEHRIKYRLVFLVNGKRAVGYDNERGKGDHRHLRDTEMRYVFKDVAGLLRDFMQDVEETNHEST